MEIKQVKRIKFSAHCLEAEIFCDRMRIDAEIELLQTGIKPGK